MTAPARQSAARDLWAYLRVRKKWWLLPVLLVVGLMAVFAVYAEGSAAIPFIYTLF